MWDFGKGPKKSSRQEPFGIQVFAMKTKERTHFPASSGMAQRGIGTINY